MTFSETGGLGASTLRVATYNIHKGVQGLGPARRLEIHNLAHAVRTLEADIICLQEVRGMNGREARRFSGHWPKQPQADFLAPEGYEAVYCTNAVTKHGEHGNALLTRWPVVNSWHEDMSDHRFEQRGLLHVELAVLGAPVHVIVVHFGLFPASRVRQAEQLRRYIAGSVPEDAPLLVAGDFNCWGTRVERLLYAAALERIGGAHCHTFPSRFPVAQLDHIYTRGLEALGLHAPSDAWWRRLSDHLPLVAELRLDLPHGTPRSEDSGLMPLYAWA